MNSLPPDCLPMSTAMRRVAYRVLRPVLPDCLPMSTGLRRVAYRVLRPLQLDWLPRPIGGAGSLILGNGLCRRIGYPVRSAAPGRLSWATAYAAGRENPRGKGFKNPVKYFFGIFKSVSKCQKCRSIHRISRLIMFCKEFQRAIEFFARY